MSKSRIYGLPVLAIDLGGTKTITAIVSANGQILAEERCLTQADEGQSSVVNRLLSAVDHILSLKNISPSQLDSISIAAAGCIDIERGLVISSPHFPGWSNVPLRDIVRDKYRVATFLLNDASAAVLGEHRFGSGRGANNLILLTVGTGIGGGIIINGKLYGGLSGSAGEIGHMTVDAGGPKCVCGNIGCLEMLASGTAMAREAKRRLSLGESSSLFQMVRGRIGAITAEEIGIAAKGGDTLALDIIGKAATYLGVGMVNVVNIFDPEMIIVGGGVAKLGDLLLDPARRVVKERVFSASAREVRILLAQLGDKAGVIGAAVFALLQSD